MNPDLARAHILGQQRLRETAAAAVAAAWTGLPGYDTEDIPAFLSMVVPVVRAARRQSVALTDAYIARRVGRQPLGINPDALQLRAGAPLEEVYRRPFVTVWTAINEGAEPAQAARNGLHRATSTAETDVQLAMRDTLREVAEADRRIKGYRRVPNPGACEFCRLVAGQRYTRHDLMPIHTRCGCGVDVITATDRAAFTGNEDNDLDLPAGVVVREHGELGPVLVSPEHHFTAL